MKKYFFAFLAALIATGGLTLPHAGLAQSVNLISNPSLENGTTESPDGWSRGRWGTNQTTFTYPVPGIHGSRAAQISIAQHTSGDAKWYFREIATTPGTRYSFSNSYRSNTPSYVTIQYRLTDGTFRWIDIGTLPSSGGSWKRFSSSFTVPASVAGLTIFHLIKSVGNLAVDDYSLTIEDASQFPRGMVSLNFDDGWKTTIANVSPILSQAGYTGTHYIITGRFDFPAYATRDQVRALAQAGHEIGAHTRTHRNLTSLSESEMRSEIIGSLQDLQAIGISGVRTFAYPFGAYNTTTKQITQEAFLGARTSNGGFNKKNGDPYLLNRQGINSNTTLDQVKGWVDAAQRDKTWLVLVFHHVDTSGEQYSTTPQTFQSIVNYLKQRGIPVVTMTEGLNLMGS